MTKRREREFVKDIDSLCKKYRVVLNIEVETEEPILVEVRNWHDDLSYNTFHDYR